MLSITSLLWVIAGLLVVIFICLLVGFTNLERAMTPELMLKQFLAGRTAMIAIDGSILTALLKDAHKSLESVRQLYTFMESSFYIAMSGNTDPEIVGAWQRALDDMKADGTFARLYSKKLTGAP